MKAIEAAKKKLLASKPSKLRWIIIGLFVLLFTILMANTFHEEYPDEYDSLLGGKYILEGKVPYRDWFQHHQPGAYVYAAGLLAFVGNSFVRFRILLALSYFILFTTFYFVYARRFKKQEVPYIYIPITLFIASIGTYFWGHMLIADSFAGIWILFAYLYMLFGVLFSKRFRLKDYLIVTSLTFLAWFTSMTYVYMILGTNILALYLLFVQSSDNQIKTIAKAIVFSFIPYGLYFLFFAITGALDDYYFSNVIYNQYYVFNYPAPYGSPINPIRYAVVIVFNFLNNIHFAISGIHGFNFSDPLVATFALSNVAIVVYLMFKKQWLIALFVIFMLAFSTPRSDPSKLPERDYQSIVYIYLSIVNGIAALILLSKYINEEVKKRTYAILASVLFVALAIFWFFSSFFAIQKFAQRYYPKYMGTAPLIYDRPEIAAHLNQLAGEEYTWVAPFDFKELFYLDSPVPTKYHWFLQHAVALEEIHQTIVEDIQETKPPIIVFRSQFAPWGGDAYEFNYFLADYLSENYIRLFEINEKDEKYDYKWTISDTQNFDIDGMFYIDKKRQNELLDKYIQQGFVERINK